MRVPVHEKHACTRKGASPREASPKSHSVFVLRISAETAADVREGFLASVCGDSVQCLDGIVDRSEFRVRDPIDGHQRVVGSDRTISCQRRQEQGERLSAGLVVVIDLGTGHHVDDPLRRRQGALGSSRSDIAPEILDCLDVLLGLDEQEDVHDHGVHGGVAGHGVLCSVCSLLGMIRP